ncbi:MAG TPA: PIN domain-containing protein [Acidimicrobiia bacterium]|nr:PIN domain-containing protein [Acidimicrobiia bacterium]
MIIEAIRLIVTLGFTAAGFAIGSELPGLVGSGGPNPDATVVLGALIGAGVGYVLGGLLGRSIHRGLDRAPDMVSTASGPQLFAGTFGLLAGLLIGAVAATPIIILLPPAIGWPSGALLVVVLASFGSRVFAARADDLLAAAGLGVRRKPVDASEASTRVFLIDTSAAIDGRILDLARVGLVRGEVRVPGFVLDELQGIADSGQQNRRRRGRRGLDVLDALTDLPGIRVRADERTFPEHPEVDAKLVASALASGGTLVTTDHNLAQAAGLRGIEVLDLQALGDSLKGVPSTGEVMTLVVERAGSEPGQGIGYLDDGTMVVVESAASLVGSSVDVEVSTALRTAVGRMLFAKLVA